jgi:hypothetical protein
MTPRIDWTAEMVRDYFEQELESHGGIVHQPMPLKIERTGKAADGQKTFNGIASAEEISRSGHVFRIKGMDVRGYNEVNPVVLAAHQQTAFGSLMPGAIGTIQKVIKSGSQLKFRGMKFDEGDELSRVWGGKVERGVIRMVSIGALAMDYEIGEEEIGTGRNKRVVRFIDVVQSELIEISVTPVGANRQAIIGNRMHRDQSERIDALQAEIESLRDLVESLADVKSGRSNGQENVDNGDELSDILAGDAGGRSVGDGIDGVLDTLQTF